MRVETIDDVVKWRLCVGCGACSYFSRGALGMSDDHGQGHRPVINGQRDTDMMRDCLKVCPGVDTPPVPSGKDADPLGGVEAGVGPVLEVWEGHATDPDTRFQGSSGGALTALARYAIERDGMHGVLHVSADPDRPLNNRTVMSRSFADLLANTGSRYAPASVCDGLQKIEDAPAPCVFIGQPSEVVALKKARQVRPDLDLKVGVTLSFFCAGSPATRGTEELLKARGVNPDEVERLRYRGRGWPGFFAVWLKGITKPVLEMTYAESWAFVQSYRPWAVHVWPDGCGEHADIACGDPWYREAGAGELGSSLVVIRTEVGKRLVHGAMAAGYLNLTPATITKVVDSQKNLLVKKGAVWGRLMSMRLMGLPVPAHPGYRLFESWLRLPSTEKVRSTLGTFRRLIARGYYKPHGSGLPTATESR